MTDLGVAARLRAAFELSPTMLAVTDLADGRIIEVNDALLRVLGYAREAVVGRQVPEVGVWVDPGQRETALVALRAGRSVRDMEMRFRTTHGEEIVAIADVVDIDGRPCVLTAFVDITARVRAEAALRESERDDGARQGRVSRHARPRAAQPAGNPHQRPGRPRPSSPTARGAASSR